MLDIPELLHVVLRNLDARSLSACSRVSRSWYGPSTELMWAQSTKLEYSVSKFIQDGVQNHFRSPLMRYLSSKPPPGVLSESLGEPDPLKPSQDDLDQALNQFKALPIDWSHELRLFKAYTQWTTRLNLSSQSMFATRILYVLQQCHPTVVQDILPRLSSVAFSGDLYPPISIFSITSLPSLRHVSFDIGRSGPSLKSWIRACQPADNLTGLTLTLTVDETMHESYMITDFSPTLRDFLSSRKWKTIELPGKVARPSLLQTLSEIESLDTLTLNGPVPLKWKGDAQLDGKGFKSLRTLRMIGFLGGDEFPKNAAFPSLVNLELDLVRPADSKEEWCPAEYLAAMARACPNLRNLEVSIPQFEHSEAIGVSDSSFIPLLALSHLQRLVVRISRATPVSLTDDFLSRAAHAWPDLRELDIDSTNSKHTLITLQGLAPLAQHCLKLRWLRIGLRPNYINTVFNPQLYGSESGYVCALKYLDVGCPSVYGSPAVSAFLSTIFPNLSLIECPEPGNYDLFSEGEYFVWTQVIKAVRDQADGDIDGLAQMLRAQDVREKLEGVEKGSGSSHEDLVQSSDSDSEDYWAYSGSEDESYSDSDSSDE